MSCEKLIFLWIIMSTAIVGRCLYLTEIRVPSVVDVREKARIVCKFDIEGDSFFSLKWYKEESEFFRYTPEFYPRIQTFSVEGVHVVESESNISVVTLSPLEYKTSGIYRCEVSGGAPHFKVVYQQANMSVLALPKENPKIEGIQTRYEVGNYVTANCTSSPSHPPPVMNWYINGAQARQLFTDYYNTGKGVKLLYLEGRTIGLNFQISDFHLREDKNGTLSIACTATVGDVTRSTEVRTYLTDPSREKLMRGSGRSYHNLKASFYVSIIVSEIGYFAFVY